jgi:Fe-S-cluster-containing dehydrogenase component
MSNADKRWALVFDVERCTGCHNCALAVYDEYVGNSFPGYAEEMPRHGHRWIDIKVRERGQGSTVDVTYLASMCQHCDDASCIKADKVGAVSKRSDGIVVISPEKAVGQRHLVDACPFGAIWWNEERQLPQHWNFDAHLIDAGWTEPRCVQACPTGALASFKVTDQELEEMRRSQDLQQLRPDLDAKPRVLYKNLNRFNKAFIAGTIVRSVDGTEDCVDDMIVRLERNGMRVAEVATNAFGVFKFDDLTSNGDTYEVVTEAGKSLSPKLVLDDSKYIGTVTIED